MEYRINGKAIKSEYAAKSNKQQNKEVMGWIKDISKEKKILDYGCGKLRYTIPLSSQARCVYAIDSREQIKRIQTINNIRGTNIMDYATTYLHNVKIHELASNEWKEQKYDYVLCSNVLSAIPIYSERINVFHNIKKVLEDEGEALISTQYSNSYFRMYADRRECIKHYDGWIINNKGKFSFYGIVSLKKLIYYARLTSLNVVRGYVKDGSAYLIVKK